MRCTCDVLLLVGLGNVLVALWIDLHLVYLLFMNEKIYLARGRSHLHSQ